MAKRKTKTADSATKSTRPRKKAASAEPQDKQRYIDGTAPERHADIEDAAAAYVVARDERIALLGEERAAKEELAATMKSHKLETYRCVDRKLEVTMTETVENVRVKTIKGDGEDE